MAIAPIPRASPRASGLVLGLLVLVAILLRLAFLFQPMRFDETVTYILLASHSLSTIVSVYLSNNNHPLHTLLVHFVTAAFGFAPWCIRAPAFLAGVLLVPATHLTFEEIVDRPTGLLAAALVASSSPLIDYSTNARGYTIETLLVLAVFFAAARILRTGARAWWWTFAVASVLGFYTVPTMAFFLAGALLWMLVSAAIGDASVDARRMAGALVAVGAGIVLSVVLLYVPFVRGSGLADLTSNRWVRSLSWGDFRAGFWASLFDDGVAWHRGLPPLVVAVLVSAFTLSLVVFGRVARFKVNPVPMTMVVCLAMMTARRLLPPDRVWLPLVPLYLGSVAVGLRWIGARVTSVVKGLSGPLIGGAVVVLLAGIGGTFVLASDAPYQTPGQVTFRDAEPIAVALGPILRDDDAVYVHTDACYVLEYYFARHGIPMHYVHRPGRTARSIGRAFVVDASRDYPDFTFGAALDESNLDRSKPYKLGLVAEFADARVLEVMNPVLRGGPGEKAGKPEEEGR